MTFLCSRLGSKVFRGKLAQPCRFYALSEDMVDPMELATGREKYQKQLRAAGKDPFSKNPVPRIPNSTRDNPNLVPSYYDCRLVTCACNPDSASVIWMWVFKGEPKRCACGHWFKLVEFKD